MFVAYVHKTCTDGFNGPVLILQPYYILILKYDIFVIKSGFLTFHLKTKTQKQPVYILNLCDILTFNMILKHENENENIIE